MATDTALVTALIVAATIRLEKMTNRLFVERTITGKFDSVCSSIYEPLPYIEIKRSPLISVSSVTANGVALVEGTDYYIKNKSSFSRILIESSIDTNFNASLNMPYPIEVSFVAGYGAAANVPEDIKTAIQQLVLFWYENRGDVSTDAEQEMPFETKMIMKGYRIVNAYG